MNWAFVVGRIFYDVRLRRMLILVDHEVKAVVDFVF